MIKLSVIDNDIARISKIIAKYHLIATVSNSEIIISDEISEELASELLNNSNIITISNCNDEFEEKNDMDEEKEKEEAKKESQTTVKKSDPLEIHEIKYQSVMRGDVFICDFGDPYDCEKAYERYAIVVSDDHSSQNPSNKNVIVIPCTTAEEYAKYETQYCFYFNENNMVDYKNSNVSKKLNTAEADAIRSVSKSRLKKYLGSLNEEFMDNYIQPIIEKALELKQKNDALKVEESDVEANSVDVMQLALLSKVDIKEIVAIANSSIGREQKIEKIVECFGFDLDKNGVQYIIEAISVAPKDEKYNLETLSDELANKNNASNVSSEEIKRLIATRIKENFKMKKLPAITFIRLINNLI